jgi:hypothetical protein
MTEAHVHALYNRQLINHATWINALHALHGETSSHLGVHAIRSCELAIEVLVEEAINAACKSIQDRLGVETGDVAAATLTGGIIERELTRYIHVELAHAT